jgi:Flp pilus assembly protein TadB
MSRAALTLVSAIVFGIGAALVIGGVGGIALGIGIAVIAPKLIMRMEPRASRTRRASLMKQAPDIADLLAATMASGAPLRAAMTAVADAVGAPSSELLLPIGAALELGADPADAWASLRDDPSLAPIALAFVRSATSGAPLSTLLAGTADDLRRKHRLAVEVAARAAGVRAVAPLAACFLPAFLLLGVVPVVASMASDLFNG